MSLAIDLFWSFRSPYSYLATPRLVRLTREYDVDVHVRVVLPLAVRVPGFFERVNPLWPPYLLRDTARIAEHLGLPYGWPRPDPIVQEFPSRRVAAEQPYIFRLTRLGVEAARRGRGLPFIAEVSRLVFGGEVVGWHEGDHLARAAERARDHARAASPCCRRRHTRRARLSWPKKGSPWNTIVGTPQCPAASRSRWFWSITAS